MYHAAIFHLNEQFVIGIIGLYFEYTYLVHDKASVWVRTCLFSVRNS